MSIIDSIQLSGSSYDVRDKSATTVVSLTQQEYDALPSSAKTANILYNITDATAGDLTQYWTSAQTQSAITEAVSGKQETLVSGTNIKTINNESILGSGNITIQGGGTDTGTVQTMIDQSISGKADSSTVTALTNTVTGHTADTSIHVTTAQTAAWNAKSDFSGSYNDLTDKPTIPTVPTSNTAFTNDAGYITSSALNGYATTGDVQTATSGKVDTSTYTTYTASTDAALATKQTTLTAGRGIDITTGETADTVSFNLPISAGTGENSIIIGDGRNISSGIVSVAEGFLTSAMTSYAHSEGSRTLASGSYSSHAEGSQTSATSEASHSEGYQTTASGKYSHSEGWGTLASGQNSHAEGKQTSATNAGAHSEGSSTTASGYYSHSEGYQTTASGRSSHAEGESSKANGRGSHAEGIYTTASTNYSHAEGAYTKASGIDSHAEGNTTQASGDMSHAEGLETVASGVCSHVEGKGTIASNDSEHASGQYNISSSASTTFGDSGNTLFSVGNGTADDARHNAFEIRQNGDIYLTKDGQDVKLQDQLGGGGGEVSSAITSGDTNAVAGGAVFDAVVYSGSTYNTELTFDANGYAENWIVGQSAITIDVSGYTSDTRAIYHFENSNGLDLGYASIYKNISTWWSSWSNNADNCTITTDGDTATTATITDIPSGTVKIRRTNESNPPKAIISGDTPETWIKDALDDHRDNTTIHITAAERSTWNNKSNFSGSYNDLTDKPTPDSALTSYSTNAVQSKALFDELRISGEGEAETTLAFEGYYTTNYPNGCTKIKVEDISSMSSNIINFEDGEGHNIGNINVNNWGNISVDTSGLQGASYEISGTTVIISYPTVTTVVRLDVSESTKYTYKAITSSTTPLKNQVVANTTALGGLSLIKLTESEYAALVTKDPNVLYVVIPDPS